jgi:hypothetical protein
MATTPGDLKDWVREQVASRVPKADLDQRDPDYIRDQLPGTWLLASLVFPGRRQAPGPDPGARYVVHWKIGSVPVGGLMEIVEFDDLRDLAWVGITGITMRGRIRLRDAAKGHTKVTFRLSYQAPGGIGGYIADRVAVGQVGRIAADTLKRLR